MVKRPVPQGAGRFYGGKTDPAVIAVAAIINLDRAGTGPGVPSGRRGRYSRMKSGETELTGLPRPCILVCRITAVGYAYGRMTRPSGGGSFL